MLTCCNLLATSPSNHFERIFRCLLPGEQEEGEGRERLGSPVYGAFCLLLFAVLFLL